MDRFQLWEHEGSGYHRVVLNQADLDLNLGFDTYQLCDHWQVTYLLSLLFLHA
jgi:hypothetical protein